MFCTFVWQLLATNIASKGEGMDGSTYSGLVKISKDPTVLTI